MLKEIFELMLFRAFLAFFVGGAITTLAIIAFAYYVLRWFA
jgi:hypothetical protein